MFPKGYLPRLRLPLSLSPREELELPESERALSEREERSGAEGRLAAGGGEGRDSETDGRLSTLGRLTGGGADRLTEGGGETSRRGAGLRISARGSGWRISERDTSGRLVAGGVTLRLESVR